MRRCTMSKLNSPIQPELEKLVDREGLHDVLDALSTICYEKADHIRTTLRDIELARLWIHTARLLDTFTEKVEL